MPAWARRAARRPGAGVGEQQLPPRLLDRHRAAPVAPGAPEALAALALADGDGALRQAVQALHWQGLAADAIGLHWLAPAARTLGRLWERDDCSFADVTIGTGRLLRELRHLDQTAPLGPGLPAPDAPHVLLMPAAGEQHTFGLALVADAFRRAGWRVTGGADGGALDPLAQVADEPVDVVGISVRSDAGAAQLPKLCAALRRAACRPGMGLLAGGPWMLACDRGPWPPSWAPMPWRPMRRQRSRGPGVSWRPRPPTAATRARVRRRRPSFATPPAVDRRARLR